METGTKRAREPEIQLPENDQRKEAVEAAELPYEASLQHFEQVLATKWAHGHAWRLEMGEAGYNLREACKHGEWGRILEEHDIPPTTMDGYIALWKIEKQIPEIREIEGPVADPEAERRGTLIAEETAKVAELRKAERKRAQPGTGDTLHIVLPIDPADHLLFQQARKADPEGTTRILQAAVAEVIAHAVA